VNVVTAPGLTSGHQRAQHCKTNPTSDNTDLQINWPLNSPFINLNNADDGGAKK